MVYEAHYNDVNADDQAEALCAEIDQLIIDLTRKLVVGNPVIMEGDFLRAGDLKALPGFDRADEIGRIGQRVVRAHVEPRVAASHGFHGKLALKLIILSCWSAKGRKCPCS